MAQKQPKKGSALEWAIVAAVVVIIGCVGCGIIAMLFGETTEQTAQAPTSAPAPTATPRPASATPEATPEPTQPPEPTPTPESSTNTPDLATIDIEPLLIQAGDLPAGLTAGQIQQEPFGKYDGIPDAINTAFQRFEANGEASGGVGVFLYNEPDAGYAFLVDTLTDENREIDIGNRGRVNTFDPATINMQAPPVTSIVFQRCSAVVDVFTSNQREEDVIVYARRLDQRLQNALCNNEQVANVMPTMPEPEPTPVPEPTATPEPTQPPLPTEPPAPVFEPITLSGSGNTVTDPMAVPFTFARVMYDQDASGLIQARAYPTTGDRDRLIVNEIGANTGAWLFTASEEEYYFEIDADGNWAITIEPLGFTDQNLDSLNGTGAWVTDVYRTGQQGATPYVAAHEGEGLAQIRLHCSSRSDLVLNEIGTITSETVANFSGDLCFWEIEADQGNPWNFAPR